MISPTHASVSVFCNMVVLSFFNFSFGIWHFLAMILFSFLPDIDSPQSFIGRIMFFISRPLSLRLGHRGFIHSLSFLGLVILVTLPFFFIFPQKASIFFIILYISYFSHIVLDCFNISGVRLMYPSNYIYVFPKNEIFRFRAGDLRFEIPIMISFIVFCIIFYFNIMKNDGFVSYLRIKFANISMAEQQFTDFEKHKYIANIKVFDKTLRSNIDFNEVEVFFVDKNKVIFYYDNSIKTIANDDKFLIKRVSLKRSINEYEKEVFTGNDFESLILKNFKCCTGKIILENTEKELFYESKEKLHEIYNEIKETNYKYYGQIKEYEKELKANKSKIIKSQLHLFENRKNALVLEYKNTEDMSKKIYLSNEIKKLSTKIDSLNFDLTSIDVYDDADIYLKINELNKKVIKNYYINLVLIK